MGSTKGVNDLRRKCLREIGISDEMNIHNPQDLRAIAELQELITVEKNIISAQNNRPLIGMIQDTLTGCYLLSREEPYRGKKRLVPVSPEEFMQYAYVIDMEHVMTRKLEIARRFYENPYNGRVLFSLLLPENMFYQKKAEGKTTFLIKHGILVKGTLDKKTLGTAHNSIVQVLFNEYGPEINSAFISNCQKLVNTWLMDRGFSVGLGDCLIEKEQIVREQIVEAELEVKAAQANMIDSDVTEMQISAILNGACNIGQRLATEDLSDDNSFKVMATAGSKGSTINIAQINGMLGQQNVEGGRVPKIFMGHKTKMKRTLPHFRSGDDRPQTRGFITSSFLKGLNPAEFFFHAMAGREGIIDTAIKTAEAGYASRRMMKVLEDFGVKYDGTVRTARGKIVQFGYGEDNMDGSKLVLTNHGPFPLDVEGTVEMLNAELELENDMIHATT